MIITKKDYIYAGIIVAILLAVWFFTKRPKPAVKDEVKAAVELEKAASDSLQKVVLMAEVDQLRLENDSIKQQNEVLQNALYENTQHTNEKREHVMQFNADSTLRFFTDYISKRRSQLQR